MSSIGNHQEGDVEFTNDSTVKWLLMPLEATGFFSLCVCVSVCLCVCVSVCYKLCLEHRRFLSHVEKCHELIKKQSLIGMW